MADRKGSATRVLVSIAFVVFAIGFVVEAASDLSANGFAILYAINAVLGVLMFVLGIMGISNGSMNVCRTVAVFVCLFAVASFVFTVFTWDLSEILKGLTTTVVWALLAWVYFDVG